MKGITVVSKPTPPAKPQAATAPPYWVSLKRRAKVVPPTTSTAPAQRWVPNGLGFSLQSGPPITSVAPSWVK